MQRIFTIIILLIITHSVTGQNMASQSQFHVDPYWYNPAAAGRYGDLQASFNYRSQWTNVSGAPTTFMGSIHKAVYSSQINGRKKYLKGQVLKSRQHLFSKKGEEFVFKHVVGGNFGTDTYGAFSQSKLGLSYALHVPFKNFAIAVGVTGQYINTKIDPEQIELLNPNDQTYNAYLNQGASNNALNVETGLLVYARGGYFGYSTNSLLNNKVSFGDNITIANSTYHHIQAGTEQVINEAISLKEHLQISLIQGLPTKYIFNTIAVYKDTYKIGLGYRYQDAAIIYLGYTYSKFLDVNYSYDLNTSSFDTYHSGSHEISVSIRVNKYFKAKMQ